MFFSLSRCGGVSSQFLKFDREHKKDQESYIAQKYLEQNNTFIRENMEDNNNCANPPPRPPWKFRKCWEKTLFENNGLNTSRAGAHFCHLQGSCSGYRQCLLQWSFKVYKALSQTVLYIRAGSFQSDLVFTLYFGFLPRNARKSGPAFFRVESDFSRRSILYPQRPGFRLFSRFAVSSFSGYWTYVRTWTISKTVLPAKKYTVQ